MPKSATIVPLSGNRDIDGILWGVKWTLPALTYSFPTQLDQFTGHPDGAIDGFRPLRAAQIKAVNDIADQLNSLIGIDLQFTPDAASANIRLSTASSLKLPGFADSGKIETAIGLSPDQTRVPTYAFGDIFFNRVDYAKPMVGTYAYQTIMHELGHALGLKHGHATQPSPGGDSVITKLPASHDTLEYSVMTYRSCLGWTVEYGYTNDTNSFPQSFMMNDIAALQYLYGADYTHNAGDTTYSWNSKTGEMSIDGKTRGRPADSKVFLTIWDGGGNDTYDLSSYGLGALDIDLGAGGFSVFSSLQLALLKVDSGIYARGNVYNALLHEGNIRSLIENAIGGDGRDSLTGNQIDNMLVGNDNADLLFGLRGADTLDGGDGYDVLTGGPGDDFLMGGRDADELLGGSGNDRLDGGRAGGDQLVGGLGNDIFVVGRYDQLEDFSPEGARNNDIIELDSAVFLKLHPGRLELSQFQSSNTDEALSADIRLFYENDQGNLYYDRDGDGPHPATFIANLRGSPLIGPDDIYII